MKAEEAAEMMESQKESDTFKQRAAVAIAFFAMVLAICGLGGSNAGKEAVNNNVLASNYFSFYQAKNVRQSALELAADEIELGWLNDPALPDAAKQAMRAKSPATGDHRALHPSRRPTRARRSCWCAPRP